MLLICKCRDSNKKNSYFRVEKIKYICRCFIRKILVNSVKVCVVIDCKVI